MGAVDIGLFRLASYYLLLIIPIGAILWLKVPILNRTIISVLRMSVQLAFVGLYLGVVFKLNKGWLNILWLLSMIVVADLSIIRGCGFNWKKFCVPLFIALLIGTLIPLLPFVGFLLHKTDILDAQYLIPVGGMILGNCLRADIIGFKAFYHNIQKQEKYFLLMLSQGATLYEAIRPFLRDACEAALAPTIATMATIGLVALPGMMTGVILGGTAPITAIKYQLAIMIAIFTGTGIAVISGILISIKKSFNDFGILEKDAVS